VLVTRRFLRRPVVQGAILAVLLAVASWLLSSAAYSGYLSKVGARGSGFDSVVDEHMRRWWLIAVPAIVALLIGRRWPVPAFLLAAASVVGHMLDRSLPAIDLLPMDLAAVVALYQLTGVTRRRTSLAALAGAVTGVYLVSVGVLDGIGITSARCPDSGLGRAMCIELIAVDRPFVPLSAQGGDAAIWMAAFSRTLMPALLLGTAWAVADSVRTHRENLRISEQRTTDLQRERDHRAALVAAAERARITRELHDVIAHGMSVMVVQAQVAAAAVRPDRDAATAALTHIVDTGRASLAEMRRLVRGDPDEGPQLAPQPGLDALPSLVDQVRRAGTPVTLLIDGTPVPLPAAVDLSAYRIVQEGLTNTRKHAGARTHATVRLTYHTSYLEIDVVDDGTATGPPAANGNGLRGIAERASILGGTLTAGPRPHRGFGIHVTLPTAAVA
jgi:signal transduction histidine kinase